MCRKLKCEPPNTSSESLLAAYQAYNTVYTQEINDILLADKIQNKDNSYGKNKKKEIQALAQSLQKDVRTLSSRHAEVGRLLGLVSVFFVSMQPCLAVPNNLNTALYSAICFSSPCSSGEMVRHTDKKQTLL